ncbi:MAG TPA: lamin tail domain-containing protein, partial [Pyrinomonadaceae bacterium]
MPSSRWRTASARRPLLAVFTAAFILLQQVAFIIPAAAQVRSPAPSGRAATRPTAKSPALGVPTVVDDPVQTNAPSPDLVISQVYGGAGCGTAGCSTYKNDFVEIFNRGGSAVSLSGKTVQYASPTGTGNFSVAASLSGTLNPGQYYLVSLASSANGVNNLPAADATGTTAVGATGGKVILANSTTALACNGGSTACSAAQLALIIDLVGFGNANFFEGTGPAPAPSTTTADFRVGNGCTDTDNNAADFTTATPAPRNTATALNACSAPTPTPTPVAGPSLSINDVSQDEGNAGTTAFTFTVTLSEPAGAGGVTFDIATADGTAQDDNPTTEDNDYVAKSLIGQTIPGGSVTYQFTVDVNGDTTTEANETFFVNVTNVTGATVADGQGQGTITNDDVSITPIHTIQGSGASSPIVGANVTTTGVVTLLKTGANTGGGAASGYFLQTPDAEADSDPNTSQGIFVFTSSVPTVAVGDEVRVTGTVVEFNGLTEIGSVTSTAVVDTGNPLPTPVTLDSTILDPAAPPTQPQLEKYEGMRLSAPALRTVAPNDNFFDVYTVLANVPRPVREPGIPASDPVPPDPTTGTPDCCIPIWDENPERLKVDTNGRAGAANAPYTSNVTFTGVTGPLDYG